MEEGGEVEGIADTAITLSLQILFPQKQWASSGGKIREFLESALISRPVKKDNVLRPVSQRIYAIVGACISKVNIEVCESLTRLTPAGWFEIQTDNLRFLFCEYSFLKGTTIILCSSVDCIATK